MTTSTPGAQKITILLGSQSPLKVQAATNSFAREAIRLYGLTPSDAGAAVKVVPFKAASNVNEQPFGYHETLSGAKNRLANTKTAAAEANISADFVATIENGIIPFSTTPSTETTFIDMPFVLIENLATGQQFLATGCGLPVPAEYVEEARKRGFDKGHVGMVLCEKFGSSCKPNDPHSYMTANRITRIEMMEQVRDIDWQLIAPVLGNL